MNMNNNNNTTDKGNTMKNNTKKIVPVIVTVDELPPIPRVPFNPSHQVVEQTCQCWQCFSGEKNVGDGPSGFDKWQDTKWCR